jgi:hypothetical protein
MREFEQETGTLIDYPKPSLDDTTDLEFWLLVEPEEGSEVHWWAHHCYRCARRFTVWWCVTTPPWSQYRPEEEPLVQAAVLADCENFPQMAYLQFRETRPRPDGYMGFICPFCHSISGDWYLHNELLDKIARGETNILAVNF